MIRCLNCGSPFPADVCSECGARQGVVSSAGEGTGRGRPEALLERQILRAVGGFPDVLVLKNEVGVGYTAAALHTALASLREELPADVAAVAARVVSRALARCRITYGLGVGSPDLVAVVRGKWRGWELKTEEGRLSEDQQRWHAAAGARSAPCEVIRSVEDAEASIERARRGTP